MNSALVFLLYCCFSVHLIFELLLYFHSSLNWQGRLFCAELKAAISNFYELMRVGIRCKWDWEWSIVGIMFLLSGAVPLFLDEKLFLVAGEVLCCKAVGDRNASHRPCCFHHFYDKDMIQTVLTQTFHAWNKYHKCINRSYTS